MGTRGLYCAVIDGEVKVAQYGQWDAYPEGQGQKMLQFVRHIVNDRKIKAFEGALRKLKELTTEEVSAMWKTAGADDSGMVDYMLAKQFGESHPELSRDTCADIMPLVLNKSVKAVHLQTEFAADSLFCEWAYVIDMDNKVLEVYKGFQKKAHRKGRFSSMVDKDNDHRTEKYYPVVLVETFSFGSLPKVEDFLQICQHPRSKATAEIKKKLAKKIKPRKVAVAK